MFWLALGSMLLLLAGLRSRGDRLHALSAIAFLCLVAAAAGALRVYAPYRIAIAVAAGLAVGLALTRIRFGYHNVAVRLLLLLMGIGASAFAIFGPAQGLF